MSADTNASRLVSSPESLEPDRVEFEAAQGEQPQREERPVQLVKRELISGLTVLAFWFCLFLGGILIGTEPHRERLQNPTGGAGMIWSWIVICAFWTITNLGLLSCVSAFLGALGKRTRFTSHNDPLNSTIVTADPNLRGLDTYYMSAVMRGFGVYILSLGGLLIMATESLLDPSQAGYVRLAPAMSIVSFYAGYDPSIFEGLLHRVNLFMQSGNQKGK